MIMINKRLKEIKRMKDEMGLGCSFDRRRFTEMAGEFVFVREINEEPAKEQLQLFIRLDNNTSGWFLKQDQDMLFPY